MTPERTSYAGQSYKLFDDYNDIHIFVEDAGFENLYEALFQRYGLGIQRVFSMNGKDAILKAAQSCSDAKCVFVVDRDWSDLLGVMPTLKNVVVLKMHSIECYLIDYKAFSWLVIGENPKCDINSLLGPAHFEDILIDVSGKLRPLFECFAAMQMGDERGKGCSHKPGTFQEKNHSCAPDVPKIARFVTDSGSPIPQSVRDYFSARVITSRGHGKFMLHFVWQGVRCRTRMRQIGIQKLMIRLAQLVDTAELLSLAEEVKARAVTK